MSESAKQGTVTLETCPLPPGWNLTEKQRTAVAVLMSGGTRKEAIQTAGYKSEAITQTFNALISSPRVRPALAYALRIAGVSDKLKAETLAGALKADKEYCAEGEIVPGGPDHGTRLKALKIALDLDGDLGATQIQGEESFEARIQTAQVAGYSDE